MPKVSAVQNRQVFRWYAVAAFVLLVVAIGVALRPSSRAAVTWPAAPPAQICGNASVLDGGPASAPAGAITVPAGNNSSVNFNQAGKTFWFAAGTHTLGTGAYSQIIPGNNVTLVGAPGAIVDSQKVNLYATTGSATGVKIQYLTFQNFGPVGANNNEGVVNHDAANNFTIEYSTVKGNAGAGVFVGDDNTLRYNCLSDNEQYGFSVYQPGGVTNVTLDHNEIARNNTYDWEAKIDGCGCTGGGKFWETSNVNITNNYIHNNYSVGIWADTNNAGFMVENNYFYENDNVGFEYEISYNVTIRNNYFGRNAVVGGPQNGGFPTGAIYLSEAGSDPRVNTTSNTTFEIYGNLLEDNWSGVILWENADRFCNSPANTSEGDCTKVNPSVATITSCNATNIANAPYYDDCRWKTQNVKVHDNIFQLTPAHIGASCTFANSCGFNGIFSQYGTYPDWSPYKGTIVEQHIMYNQNNTFSNNTYQGSWRFMPVEQGTSKTFAQWQAAPYSQDAGSTLSATVSSPSGTPTPTPSATATPTPTATATPTPTASPAYKQGDVNRDGAVNVFDLSILLTNFGKTAAQSTNPNADCTGDGNVNVFDLSMLLSKWGT